MPEPKPAEVYIEEKARAMCQRSLTLLSLLLVIGCSPRRLPAQRETSPGGLLDTSIEDLMKIDIDSVYSASKFSQKVTQAPASVTIITSEEIQKYGYRTLADILRTVRGFYVNYDRNYSYVGVRGFGRPGDYNSRIALLVDGHRLNDVIYDSALLGTEFPVDVNLIDRVEVIRGPNSSLYLADAFLAVINIITKRGGGLKGVEVSGILGSYESYESRITYGNEFENGLNVMLSGAYYNSGGHNQLFFPNFNSPATNNGISTVDDDEFHQGFAEVSYRDFTLRGAYGSREKGIPTASFGAIFNDRQNRTVDARGFLDLQYERKLGDGWQFDGRTYYDEYNYDRTYAYDHSQSGGPSRVVNRDFGRAEWWGTEANVSKILLHRHRVTVGAAFEDRFHQNQRNYDEQPYVLYLNNRKSSEIGGVYAQDEIQFRKDLILNLGLRYDHYSTFGGTTNPRAALIYNPAERTTLKFLYGQAFRPPNNFELYYDAPGYEDNPSLRPETVKTTETVWEQYFPHQFRLAVSGFYYPIRHVISARPDRHTGLVQYRNFDQLDIKGMDVDLKRKLAWGLEGGVSYSFQEVRNPRTRYHISNSPKHLGQAYLSVPLVKKALLASMDVQYVGRRYTPHQHITSAYALPNFTLLSRNFWGGWQVSASLYNAFNQKYGDPAGPGLPEDIVYQDGRNFRVQIGYDFNLR